jgi:hypothetical protein
MVQGVSKDDKVRLPVGVVIEIVGEDTVDNIIDTEEEG